MPGLATGQHLPRLASSESEPTEVPEQGPQLLIASIARGGGEDHALASTAHASRFPGFAAVGGGTFIFGARHHAFIGRSWSSLAARDCRTGRLERGAGLWEEPSGGLFHGPEHRFERVPAIGQGIRDLRRRRWNDPAHDQVLPLERAKLAGQHLGRHSADTPPKLTEPVRPVEQVPKNPRNPRAGDDVEISLQRTRPRRRIARGGVRRAHDSRHKVT